jgi:regulator of sigma D
LLRSELYELEKSVGAIIDEKSTTDLFDYQQLIVEQVAYVKNLGSELKKKWTHELLSNAKEQVIKRYVQYHQAGIIQLSDRVSGFIPALNFTTELRAAQTELFGQLNAVLENILAFLQRQFYQYFDIDHKATIYCCQQLISKISGFEQEVKSYNGSLVDRSLIEVIFKSLNEIAVEGSFSGISSRQADQSLKVARMTYQLLFFGSNTTTESLTRALYQQNFNSLYFYNWYRDHILKQIALMTDKKERTDFINDQIKTFEVVFVSADKAIQPELPYTNIFIMPWLQEQTGSGVKRTDLKSGVDQFPLNLSVPQFALFIRIFSKTGCFPIENVAMITRFFSEHFTTKKQAHVSRKSFARAFYNLDQSAAAVVRDFLQKMLNYLNKTYFP